MNQKKAYPTAPDNALYVEPNFLGAELFMWALGIEAPTAHRFFDMELDTIERMVDFDSAALARDPDFDKASKPAP